LVKNIKVNEKRLEFFKEMTSWMSNQLAITHTSILPLRNLLPLDSFQTTHGNPLTSFAVNLKFRFAYLETFLESYFYRSSLGSPYPIGEINITQGLQEFLKAVITILK
jgi:hypothetical protein